MEPNDFCEALVTALDADTELRDIIHGPQAGPARGRGRNYSEVRWVPLTLIKPVGRIESINVMPYRFDLDAQSGNLHYFPRDVQFVACARQNTSGGDRLGPMAEIGDDRLTLHPARYYPRIDKKRSETKCLTWDDCFDEQGLSLDFADALRAFLTKLESSEHAPV